MATKIIITIEGGIVQAIGSSAQDVEVTIIDFDDQSEETSIITTGRTPDYFFEEGKAWMQMRGKQQIADLSKESQIIVKELKKHKV